MHRSGRDWYSPDSYPQVLDCKSEESHTCRGLPKEQGGSWAPTLGVLHWKDEPPGHLFRDLKTG